VDGSPPESDPRSLPLLRLRRIEATARSGSIARELVSQALEAWDCTALADDALLCATELVSNATLHTRAPFDLTLRRLDGGVHIEVIDDRPAELPVAVPTHGTAADITLRSMTGRGLHIVGTLASRWGFTTSDTGKAVWVELRTGRDGDRWTPPVISVGHRHEPDSALVSLHLLGLPVRAAVASGVQVDELVRDLQLRASQDVVADDERDRLYELLDASASPRLAGRHAALRAAAMGLERFDLAFETTLTSLVATGQVSRVLATLSERLLAGRAMLLDEVVAFRAWLEEETRWQLDGNEPRPCPLDA